jgi:hypothetical protein
MTHALKGARRPQESDRALFEDAHFTDIWNDAQNARTAVVRAHVQSLVRRIRRALINRAAMNRASMNQALTQAGMGVATPGTDQKTERRMSADREKSSLAGGEIDGSACV